MLGSVISVNCSWPEFFCFGSRRISACKLLLDSKCISVKCEGDKGNEYKMFCYIPNPTKNIAVCQKKKKKKKKKKKIYIKIKKMDS